MTDCKTSRPPRRVYGRMQTRTPKGERLAALQDLLPELEIPAAETVDPEALYPKPCAQLWLEIGFGNGEHLAALMERHPERAYIGAEPFVNGMAAFLRSIRDRPHHNIRVWPEDAITLAQMLPDRCVDGIYILNPDPWPKKRHHKRRIVNRENLNVLARILKPGGTLIMSTDVNDLADWMVTQTFIHPCFEWTAEKAGDWRTPPPDWIKTRYEAKGEKKGSRQTYLLFKRK